MSAHPGLGEIKTLLSAQLPGLIHELVPDARREGNVFSAPNPTRSGDSRGSFKVWANGAWKEFDEGVGGDLIELICYVHGQPLKSPEGRKFARQWALERLGLANGDRQAMARARYAAAKKHKEATERELNREAYIARRVQEIAAGASPCDPHDPRDPVTSYLSGRGLALRDLKNPAQLPKLRRNFEHWTAKQVFGAVMILPLRGRNGNITGIHATFLTQDDDGVWRKAKLPPGQSAKLMLGQKKGSIVPVCQGGEGMTVQQLGQAGLARPVVLAEGYETALALALALGDQRVWACLDLGNIAAAPVDHKAIDAVVVALENDAKRPALKQRETVLDRLRARHPNVLTMTPPSGWADFADGMEPDGKDQS